MHKLLIIDHKFRHIAMLRFDAILGVFASKAKILSGDGTGAAVGVTTRAAHRWYHKIAGFQPLDASSNLDNLSQCLMSQHEIVISRWWRTKFEGADLLICTANTDLQHA